MKQAIKPDAAAAMIPDRASLLIDALVAAGRSGLTVIANDTAVPGRGIAGTLEVELVPQATLVERLRSGGVGLGGVLTATGLGTPVAEGKLVITLQGRDYLLEEPIRADFALIAARSSD